MNSLVLDPSNTATIYASTSTGGVFKSSDGGDNWAGVNFGLSTTNVAALAVDPSHTSTIYAGTIGGGVFRTTDGGTNWNAMNSGLTGTTVRALAILSSNTATVYAGTSVGGVFKSTNSGGSWTAVSPGLPILDIRSIVINSSNGATLYAGTAGAGVFKSTDAGATWKLTGTGIATPPNVTINQSGGQPDPTDVSSINFTVLFSEAVTGFGNSGVTLSGTAGATTAVVTGRSATYNVAVSGMTGSGTVLATIGPGVATGSLSGLGNTASTSVDNTVTFSITSLIKKRKGQVTSD